MAGPVGLRRKAQINQTRLSKKKRGPMIPSLQQSVSSISRAIAVRLKVAFSRTAKKKPRPLVGILNYQGLTTNVLDGFIEWEEIEVCIFFASMRSTAC